MAKRCIDGAIIHQYLEEVWEVGGGLIGGLAQDERLSEGARKQVKVMIHRIGVKTMNTTKPCSLPHHPSFFSTTIFKVLV